MSDSQFVELMACLGFGFGSLFWFAFLFLIFGWRS